MSDFNMLVVDDDRNLAEGLTEILEIGGCRYLARPINVKTVRETIEAVFPADE